MQPSLATRRTPTPARVHTIGQREYPSAGELCQRPRLSRAGAVAEKPRGRTSPLQTGPHASCALPLGPFRLTGGMSLDSLTREYRGPGDLAVSETLGRVVRSQCEDIWILLDREQEEPHIELRLHNHARSEALENASGGERIRLPVRVLPDFLQALVRAQDQVRAWGLLKRSRPATSLGGPTRRMDARQFPRVAMNPAAECRVVDPEGPQVVQAIVGQVKDLSRGGAQAWFPQRFPQLKQVDVFMTIEGVSFRGRAEIVGPEEHGRAEAEGGLYRHNLRWVALHAQGMAALSRVAPGV